LPCAIHKKGDKEIIVFVKRLLGIENQFDLDVQRVMIVGLGNPGREYRENRHNVGFMVVDALAEKFGITPGKVKSKAILGDGRVGGTRVVLVKPQTFMNLSGQAVASLVKFYKIPLDRMLVIHDDLDLPLGTLRLRPGGG
jgi:PTH1 family peptidyl-tRNA hydrolase